jgi:hypothetical protein
MDANLKQNQELKHQLKNDKNQYSNALGEMEESNA